MVLDFSSSSLISSTSFNLGNLFLDRNTFEEGAHAFYAPISKDVGIKVGKNSTGLNALFMREFIILKGIEPTGLTPEAFCHGLVKYLHPFTNKNVVAPYILMQHITGSSPLQLLDLMINEKYALSPEYRSAATTHERLAWAYNHPEFEAHRIQHQRILKVMRLQYFLTMCDHEENLTNFIIHEGLWKIIDFSCETIPARTRLKMTERARPYLDQSMPLKSLHKILNKRGFLIKQ